MNNNASVRRVDVMRKVQGFDGVVEINYSTQTYLELVCRILLPLWHFFLFLFVLALGSGDMSSQAMGMKVMVTISFGEFVTVPESIQTNGALA